MKTLLDETLDFMGKNHLFPQDIVYIGSPDGVYAEWALFRVLSGYYYEDYQDHPAVAKDLKIIFKDGKMLERVERPVSSSFISSWSLATTDTVPEKMKCLVNIFPTNTSQTYLLADINT